MAESFACKDIGISCGFTASAGSHDELLKKVAEHAKAAHGMKSIDKETMAKVQGAIKKK